MSMNFALQALIKLSPKGLEAIDEFLSLNAEDPWGKLGEKYSWALDFKNACVEDRSSNIPYRGYADNVRDCPLDKEAGLWAISCQLNAMFGHDQADAFCKYVIPNISTQATILLCYEENEESFEVFSYVGGNSQTTETSPVWSEVNLKRDRPSSAKQSYYHDFRKELPWLNDWNPANFTNPLDEILQTDLKEV